MNTPDRALKIAKSRLNTGTYMLGTGDCDTPIEGPSDCFGFAFNICYGVRRHRPGFNRGPWATVSDDLNCNSAIEDAQHHKELFEEVANIADVREGDLIAYPTFTLKDSAGNLHKYIGHIAIVSGIYATKPSRYHDLDVIQCAGPNGRHPGIFQTDGSHWDTHDHTWPLPQHRTHILRPIQGHN